MNLKESIRLAIDNIRVNRMRSILTMLGIIIGISAVITITTIGTSLKKTISNSLNSFGGVNSITCYMTAKYPEDDADWDTWVYPDMTEKEILTWEDMSGFIEAKTDSIEDVVIGNSYGSASVVTDEGEAKVSLMGITRGYLDSNRIKLLSGRDINLVDNDEAKAAALVSDLFVKYACDGKNPVGQKFQIEISGGNIINVYVAGVYKYDPNLMGGYRSKVAEKDIETYLFLPFTFAIDKAQSEYSYEGIDVFTIKTKEDVDATAFADEAQNYFAEHKYNGTDASAEFTIETYDMASEMQEISQVLDVITIAIAIIASISLVVGGVGVMNIMLVSVVERTREIGIRKALGARKKNIQLQFLTEAVVICLIGGFIGIAIGVLNGYLLSLIGGQVLKSMEEELSSYLTISVSPSVTAIVISVVFSMLVGIVFGSYPAKRAAELSPIEALRYE